MRRIKKILLISVASVLLLMLLGIVLTAIYEDEVKAFALEKIQEQLKTEFSVSETDLSIWSQFPNTSLRLQDLYIQETFHSGDTLIFAEEIFLEFDLFNLFSGDYVIEEVTIKGGHLNLKWDEDLSDNFHFWNEVENDSSDFQFEIESIELKNTRVFIDHQPSNFKLDTYVKRCDANGEFANSVFDLNIVSDLLLNSIQIDEDLYAHKNDIQLNYSIRIDQNENQYSFNNGDLTIDNLDFVAGGLIGITEQGTYCNLDFNGTSLPVKNVKNLVPKKFIKTLERYKIEGKFDANCTIKGYTSSGRVPDVFIDFKLNGIDFEHYKSGVAISDIVSSVQFEKKQNSEPTININNLNADFEKGLFSLSGNINGFSHPEFDLKLIGNINLADFKSFTESTFFEKTEGTIRFESSVKGKLTSLSPLIAEEINNLESNADLELSNASFQLSGSQHYFENLNGKVIINNELATINSISGNIGSSDFQLEGTANNLLSFILVNDQTLVCDASLKSEMLNLNEILSNDKGNKTEEQYSLILPENLRFKFNVNVDQLIFREFSATDIHGQVKFKDQVLLIEPLTYRNSNGLISGKLSIDGKKKEEFLLTSSLNVDQIDIHELFFQFEDFGQDFLVKDNIKGAITADILFSSTMDDHLNFYPSEIYSLINFNIDNGELIELTSMKQICSYIRDNGFVATFVNEDKLEEKLDHIYFSQLKNTIEIKNGMINIPEMLISSSAMDISVEGEHYFNNDINYTLGFKIRDILSKGNQTEFGEVEDDGLSNSFFLSMTGNTSDPEFGYDRLAHKEKRKEDFQNEKQTLKDLIRDEFTKTGNDQDSTKKDEPKEVTIIVDDKKKEEKKKNWFDNDEEKDDDDDEWDDDDDF